MLTGARANVRLTALVKGADRYADDYRVSAAIDTDAGKVGQSSCTCPAYGRFRGVCKHVIALVMAYNEHPDDFAAADDGNGSTNGIGRGAAGLVPRQPAVRTTRALDLFMRQQDDERTRRSQSRQLDLLKEIGGLAGFRRCRRRSPDGAVHAHRQRVAAALLEFLAEQLRGEIPHRSAVARHLLCGQGHRLAAAIREKPRVRRIRQEARVRALARRL